MKSFFKYVLATITGIVISFFVIVLLGFIIIGAMVSSLNKDKDVVVAENSVLYINLSHQIYERTIPNPFEGVDFPGFSSPNNLGLDDILTRIKAAGEDSRIKGIYLDLSAVSASFATLQEIRDALVAFKAESGKFIIAYSEHYSQRAYYLASTADKIYLNPEGGLDFNGLASEVTFYKGSLDKLGIEMQVVKVGSYKSAVEPFIMEKMSDENREQVASLLGSMYDHFLNEIAESRDLHRDSLFAIANEFKARNPEGAVKSGLVDGTKYKDELLDELRSLLDIGKDKDIKSVSLVKYRPSARKAGSTTSRDRVAIVYAVGEIVSGEGSDSQIGSERISRELRKVRLDDKVKAVVLRVNSPGGSALASDVIWREIDLIRQEKPVIVSMSDVAASGGYYIAAAADSIFAQPNTITGSIGVLGLVPNLRNLWNDKLGITFDGVKTAKYADFLSGSFDRPLTAEERNILQSEVNNVYDTFTQKVADGREISQARVDSIGQGRVWSGTQAVELGLVDRLGGIDDAVKAAAGMAGLENYRLVQYPAIKQPFESIFSTSSDKISTWFAKRELGEQYHYLEQLRSFVKNSGIQARLPYTIAIY